MIHRCFPHVVNIAMQTILSELKENPYWPVIKSSTESSGPSQELKEYARAVESNPVGQTHNIVGICPKSGQHREELQNIIVRGNEQGVWTVCRVQLLCDCDT
jgi:hypothetical protein